MRKVNIRSYIGIAILIVFFSCAKGATIAPGESQKIQNLRAFAKLYGYVKYFHPSDEASAIDWDKFAIFGAKQVKDVKDTAELKAALEALFLPIAPTIQIYTSDQKPEDPIKHVPDDTTGLKIVAWQHLGLGPYSPWAGFWNYKSVRLNRNPGGMIQSVDSTEHRGKEIKLKAFVRTNVTGAGNQSGLWLQVHREGIKRGFFDKMDSRPIASKESKDWKAYEIIGTVANDATKISFGCHIKGMGRLWADEFELFAKNEKNEWETIRVENPGFEGDLQKGWRTINPAYLHRNVTKEPYNGKKCLLICSQSSSGQLFEEHPKIGEAVNKPLDSGLFCQIPLALYSDENGTLGKNEKYPLRKLLEEIESVHISELTANDEDVRLADVVIAWNVFQHFYPYFDVVNVDWESELTNTLQKSMTDKNERDFYYTLSRLIAKLQDGHARFIHKIQREWAYLPFSIDWVERQVVVIVSKHTGIRKGDIIVSIDGTKAEQALLDNEKYISGSRQRERVRSLQPFGYGDKGTKANLTIKRGSEIFQIQVERIRRGWIYEPKKMPKIDKIQDDIFYVDLTRAQWKEIKERIHDLAEAKGVIFDLRGYPKLNNDGVINHLLHEKDTSDAWMRIPKIIYPDREKLAGYDCSGWSLEPKEPRIRGKVVFLTDARAISYAESVMGFIEHYKLAEIVGQPTAGTNGNINKFTLPGGYRCVWTGMKVVKHDGSQHHLIGIKPTVPVQRTIQGVIEGRDEFLEKALEIISK